MFTNIFWQPITYDLETLEEFEAKESIDNRQARHLLSQTYEMIKADVDDKNLAKEKRREKKLILKAKEKASSLENVYYILSNYKIMNGFFCYRTSRNIVRKVKKLKTKKWTKNFQKMMIWIFLKKKKMMMITSP